MKNILLILLFIAASTTSAGTSNFHDEAGKAAAEESFNQLQSGTCSTRIDEESKRLQREMFKEVLEEYGKPEDASPAMGPKADKIYLFISSSMPIETLRNYARDIEEIKDQEVVMVLRGFVGGMKKIMPTRDFVLNVLKKDPDCSGKECEAYNVNIVVDPLLFQRFGVEVVPTLVHETAGEFLSISGDASLNYLLEMLKSG